MSEDFSAECRLERSSFLKNPGKPEYMRSVQPEELKNLGFQSMFIPTFAIIGEILVGGMTAGQWISFLPMK